MSRSHLPPGIPEGADPATIVDDGINPPYVASGRPYESYARPAAPAAASRLPEGVTRRHVWAAVLDSLWWLIAAVVCLPAGIVLLANNNVGVGLLGLGGGIISAIQAIRTWV